MVKGGLQAVRVGVLALQGGVAEHLASLDRLDRRERGLGHRGVTSRKVLVSSDLEGLDGLILPGGESTAVGKLLGTQGSGGPLPEPAPNRAPEGAVPRKDESLLQGILRRAAEGMALWGTCMGAILLARRLENDSRLHLGLMDIEVRRNAYGAQLDSFIAQFNIAGVEDGPFPCVFIRAPIIVGTGPAVEVLALGTGGSILACRQGRLLATTFHPELTDDLRVHAYFVGMAGSRP